MFMAIFKPTIWPSFSSGHYHNSNVITQYPAESEISCSHQQYSTSVCSHNSLPAATEKTRPPGGPMSCLERVNEHETMRLWEGNRVFQMRNGVALFLHTM